MIVQGISCWHHKGGTGKSTINSNLAVALAAKGWKILLVDMDVQADLSTALGVDGHAGFDNGHNLRSALLTKGLHSIKPIKNVRPGLDLVPGGSELRRVAQALEGARKNDEESTSVFVDGAFAPIAEFYDLIIFDLAPTFTVLHTAVFSSLHYIVLVADDGDFAEKAARTSTECVAEVQQKQNPDLEILGLVINKWSPQTSAPNFEQIQAVAGPAVRIFTPPIRLAPGVDKMMKKYGLSAGELAGYSDAVKKTVLKSLRERKRGVAPAGPTPKAVPPAAAKLAADMDAVFKEIVSEYRAAQERWLARNGVEAP